MGRSGVELEGAEVLFSEAGVSDSEGGAEFLEACAGGGGGVGPVLEGVDVGFDVVWGVDGVDVGFVGLFAAGVFGGVLFGEESDGEELLLVELLAFASAVGFAADGDAEESAGDVGDDGGAGDGVVEVAEPAGLVEGGLSFGGGVGGGFEDECEGGGVDESAGGGLDGGGVGPACGEFFVGEEVGLAEGVVGVGLEDPGGEGCGEADDGASGFGGVCDGGEDFRGDVGGAGGGVWGPVGACGVDEGVEEADGDFLFVGDGDGDVEGDVAEGGEGAVVVVLEEVGGDVSVGACDPVEGAVEVSEGGAVHVLGGGLGVVGEVSVEFEDGGGGGAGGDEPEEFA